MIADSVHSARCGRAASAPGPDTQGSESELFKKVPSIDELDSFDLGDQNIDITIRGIGEMRPDRSATSVNRVELTDNANQVATRLANVFLKEDNPAFADDMLTTSKQIARALTGGKSYTELKAVTDNLGTTHHEAGTLWVGANPDTSVTNLWGRFHEVANAWVAGPALFPSVGSPNPMLTGVALARRTAERMFEAPIADASDGVLTLFSGVNLDGWEHVGTGSIAIDANGDLTTNSGPGVLWYKKVQFRDFELRLGWRTSNDSDNGGIFVRFPDPGGDPSVPINSGYEIQIDKVGAPDGADIHKTGSIYGTQAPLVTAANPAGQWNEFVIRVEGQTYNVTLNGQKVITDFKGNRSRRGHIGLQNHSASSQVAYRDIKVTPL